MATSFQAYVDRENIGNSVSKNHVSKGAPGQKGLSTKAFHAPTPRKALGDLGNIQNSTTKKFQTPKPSKVKIFEDTPKPKTSVKSKKGTFSVLNTNKVNNKILSDVKLKTKKEDMLPEIENMTPFVDKENDIPTPDHIIQLLNHRGLLNRSSLVPPTKQEDVKTPCSHYEFEPFEAPMFGDTIANIVSYDEVPQLVEVDPNFGLDFLPPLDEIDLTLMS